MWFFFFALFLEDDVITVKTPAFAESVTEGDVRWEKGETRALSLLQSECFLEVPLPPLPTPLTVISGPALCPCLHKQRAFSWLCRRGVECLPQGMLWLLEAPWQVAFDCLFSCWRHSCRRWSGLWDWNWQGRPVLYPCQFLWSPLGFVT